MKNILHYLLALVCCLTSASCGRIEQDDSVRCNTKIADFLYGVEYDDYDFDACKRYFDSQYIPSGAGCSEVRRANFVGRNLDWYINNNASAIIKINRNEDHYASIGVVGCFPQFSNDVARDGKYNKVYKYLPFKTEDGVNEYGLYVGVNVVPTGETSFDKSSWKHNEYGHGAANTNPSSSMTCCVNYLPRILLDRARTVEEAKNLILSINWTEPRDFPHKGETQSFHWLICDETTSCVLEFMDNVPVFTQSTEVDKPSYSTIMTNFSNCLKKEGVFQTNGTGYERWDKLYDYYNHFECSFVGMEKLMSTVFYSKAYTEPVGSRFFWLTEYANDSFPAEKLYGHPELFESQFFRDLVQLRLDLYKDRSTWFTDNCQLWFTTHTSIYDLDTKTIRILVHEGLSGMTDFYEAGFDVHFEKPLHRL